MYIEYTGQCMEGARLYVHRVHTAIKANLQRNFKGSCQEEADFVPALSCQFSELLPAINM